MPIINRHTETNIHGYCEVSRDYRIARSAALDANPNPPPPPRIACPMVNASRSTGAYGRMALAGTDAEHLNRWSKAIGLTPLGMRVVAYISGRRPNIVRNFIQCNFNDQVINSGWLHSLKQNVNTGVLDQGVFTQEAMNAFVWAFHPELKGTDITQEWLYSGAGDTLYLDSTHIQQVVDYNIAKSGRNNTWIGRKISYFEMKVLLVDTLAQEITLDPCNPNKRIKAILVRDIYDLYRYGWIPALVEQSLAEAGLIELDSLSGASTPSLKDETEVSP